MTRGQQAPANTPKEKRPFNVPNSIKDPSTANDSVAYSFLDQARQQQKLAGGSQQQNLHQQQQSRADAPASFLSHPHISTREENVSRAGTGGEIQTPLTAVVGSKTEKHPSSSGDLPLRLEHDLAGQDVSWTGQDTSWTALDVTQPVPASLSGGGGTATSMSTADSTDAAEATPARYDNVQSLLVAPSDSVIPESAAGYGDKTPRVPFVYVPAVDTQDPFGLAQSLDLPVTPRIQGDPLPVQPGSTGTEHQQQHTPTEFNMSRLEPRVGAAASRTSPQVPFAPLHAVPKRNDDWSQWPDIVPVPAAATTTAAAVGQDNTKRPTYPRTDSLGASTLDLLPEHSDSGGGVTPRAPGDPFSLKFAEL